MKKITFKTISMVLWFLTAILAGYEIFLARSITYRLYIDILNYFSVPINVLERLSAAAVGNIASLFMAILAIAIIIGGFDYHWSYGGEKRSLKILGFTLLFQFAFFALYIFLP